MPQIRPRFSPRWTRLPSWQRVYPVFVLVITLTMVSAQPLFAQTGAPQLRRDRHADREIQIRYPRARVTSEPENGQQGDATYNQVHRVSPTAFGTRANQVGPSAPLRPTPR